MNNPFANVGNVLKGQLEELGQAIKLKIEIELLQEAARGVMGKLLEIDTKLENIEKYQAIRDILSKV